MACCLVDGALIAGVMVGVDAVAAGLFGASAIFSFVALDMGAGSALMVGSIMGVVPSFCDAFAGRSGSARLA